jgi:hypothetical protein
MRSFGTRSLAALAVSLCIAAGVSPAAQAADQLKAGDVVAVCGDSITEQKLYSVFIETYLAACRPGGTIRTAQFGWGGDKMETFWGRGGPGPILAVHPTVVTTCYGMNDGGYRPIEPATTQKYHDGMTRLVQALKQGGVRLVIVGSPGVVDADTFHRNPKDATMYNQTLASMGDIARQVAAEQGCTFANLHDVMMDVMTRAKAKYGAAYQVAGGDGVHPSANGHLVLAYAFLKAMGCDGNIGTITLDMASSKATATEGHKVLSSQNGAVEVESTRYPFCFTGKPEDSWATTGIIQFFPFNDDLNRFRLVVTGLPAQGDAKVRVTWGAASKEFAAADLTRGINLAAEFMDNPFAEPFKRVMGSINYKQGWETPFYKTYLSGEFKKDLQAADPEAAAAMDRVIPGLVKRDAQLAAGVAAQVTPVKHTIKVELVK